VNEPWLALAAVLLNVAAQLAIKLAGGSPQPLPLAAALACYGLSFWLTFKIYAANPLSVAAPVMAGAIFLLTPLAAVTILGENLSAPRIVGIGLIFAGILVVTRVS
jgi:multidrug transporter EmrE-like cation transporter